MRPDQVSRWLGEARFRAYLEARQSDHEQAVALYRWNGEVSAAFPRGYLPPTRGRVIASLSFGFWQALFSGGYEGLWRATLSGDFPNGDGKRREVASLVGPVLQFRNRIAHHEAIFSSDLDRQHRRILQLTSFIDREAERYIASLSRVEELLREKP